MDLFVETDTFDDKQTFQRKIFMAQRTKSVKQKADEESKQVEQFLQSEREKYRVFQDEPKLLILGSSDSGKSTLLKQLKIIYGDGFTEEEINGFRKQIIKNIIEICQKIVADLDDSIKEKYENVATIETTDLQSSYLDDQMIKSISTFWNEPVIQSEFEKIKADVPESTTYFFQNLSQKVSIASVLTNEDILLIRTVTQQITDTVFIIEKLTFHFYDVSGLKHHRKHWIAYFEDVLTIVFVVSLSSYDQVMVEDMKTNRMNDAIDLFDQMVNHPLLAKPDMMIFYNKKDLFDKKIKQSPLKNYFPDYNGREYSVDDGYNYFKRRFKNACKSETKFLNHFLTCCTDTTFMRSVIKVLIQSIMKNKMKNVGML
ncbi:guanine nucleotide binding protein, alpha subunit [Globomyces pollinis-pini]|nr:guanine nucleotide binding protein, alpha subunit [Globomyces pollinis-pini]